jgi:hypothetical protein
MELILSRPGALSTFITEWKGKWVPAILEYCRALKKKDIVKLMSDHQYSTGMHALLREVHVL